MERLKIEIIKRLSDCHESKRLFHGRGHCFSGLEDVLIDWYDPVILIILYQQRSESWLSELVELLRSEIDGFQAIVLQERFIKYSPSRILFGQLPEEVYAFEHDLKYRLCLNQAQNIGFFLDMSVARKFIRDRAADKKILNLFAYSCSFSVAAIAGNAEQVINLDMNRNALALGRFNHQINNLDQRKASFMALELFRSFSKLKKLAPFDLIICDPPADQGKNFRAERDWPKLVNKLPSLLKTGGELLLCLSSPHLSPGYLEVLFRKNCPHAQLLNIFQAGENFPEIDKEKGLNILLYRVS